MLPRVDSDARREPSSSIRDRQTVETQPIVPAVPDVDLDTALLPRDHPQWVKDTLSVSNKARELLARLKPVVIKILTFWDHRVRSVLVGNSRVSIDPSGSYRIE
ncbi:MAG: hypothetical protein JO322_09825 [Candidatus Eremiobacteraeota bacterium]|nr:hypothetical protein [Candidatus Eremiobacteraeota bacterium]